MKCGNYAYSYVLLSYTPVLDDSLLYHVGQEARAVGLWGITHITAFTCQGGAIQSLNDKPVNIVDRFIYIGNNISSIERDVSKRIVKSVGRVAKFLFISSASTLSVLNIYHLILVVKKYDYYGIVVTPYKNIDMAIPLKKLRFILTDRSDSHMTDVLYSHIITMTTINYTNT